MAEGVQVALELGLRIFITCNATWSGHVGVSNAVAEGRSELGPPVISNLDEKVLPLYRQGPPIPNSVGI